MIATLYYPGFPPGMIVEAIEGERVKIGDIVTIPINHVGVLRSGDRVQIFQAWRGCYMGDGSRKPATFIRGVCTSSSIKHLLGIVQVFPITEQWARETFLLKEEHEEKEHYERV